jgi:hypothetical protein
MKVSTRIIEERKHKYPPGTKVVYMSINESFPKILTIGKTYTVTAAMNYSIGVIGDNNVETFPFTEQFISLSEYREKQLNKIL